MDYNEYMGRVANAIQKSASYTSDGAKVMRIRYKGTEVSCTIQVATNGDILSKIGASGAEAADPVFTLGSSATTGTIDVSATGATTFGLIADFINTLTNYECVLVDCLRADTSNNACLLRAASSTGVMTPSGAAIYLDGDTTNVNGLSMAIKPYTLCSDLPSNKKEDTKYRNMLHRVRVKIAMGSSTTSVLQLYDGETKIWEQSISATGGSATLTVDDTPIQSTIGKPLLARVHMTFGTTGCGAAEIYVIGKSVKMID